jgi:hypothetical protein
MNESRAKASWLQGIDASSSDQSAHQKSDGECNTNDSQWALTNPLTRLRDQAVLYRLPGFTANDELIGRLVNDRSQPIDRAMGAVLVGMRCAIGMFGRALA